MGRLTVTNAPETKTVEARADQAAIRDFVLAYYHFIGARVEREHVIIDEELARELEGPWAKPREFHFRFETEGRTPGAEAEFVGPGSLRLDEIIGSVRRRRRVGQGFLDLPVPGNQALPLRGGVNGNRSAAPLPVVAWEPVLALGFRLGRYGETAEEELYQTAVNLVSGKPYSEFPMEELSTRALREVRPFPAPVARRRLSFKKAYRTGCLDVVRRLGQGDAAWADDATARLTKEKEHLQAYFAQAAREREHAGAGGAFAAGWENEATTELQRRLDEEALRFRPRVRIRLYAAAILHAPTVRSPLPNGNGPGICVFDALEHACRSLSSDSRRASYCGS